jgi:hypothetical protein
MTRFQNRLVATLIAGICLVGPGFIRAAKAPLSREKLQSEATHIVSGLVLEVGSHVEKSRIEKSIGIHRDRIYRIKVKVSAVSKGSTLKPGDEIEILAWKPARRIPPEPGLQGHETIPKKGDTATFYLAGGKGNSLEPLLPNGIVIEEGSS